MHFWVGTIGILFYVIPMYWAGITQGLEWKQFTENGTLAHPNFLETVTHIKYMYHMRAFGGLLYFIGAVLMAWNLVKTAAGAKVVDEKFTMPPALNSHEEEKVPAGMMYKHRWLESRALLFTGLSLVAVLIGGLFEIVPMYLVKSNVKTIDSVTPYTALEQYGRDVYIREGCYTCHSQMIRPFRSEVVRYDWKDQRDYSKAGEFVYDHPFQWGSKRIGPDLHRIGGKYPHSWHFSHMADPESTSKGSIMPGYTNLYDDEIKWSFAPKSIKALRKVGVPYKPGYEDECIDDMKKQADLIFKELKKTNSKIEVRGTLYEPDPDKEIIALIAYLQRMGTDIKKVAALPKDKPEEKTND